MCSLFRRFGPPVLAAALGLGALAAAEKRAPPIAVRFHAGANALDTGVFSMPVALGGDPPRQVVVERVPSISERDIVAFYPFRAAGGGSYGVEFQLSRHGQLTLQNLSLAHRGGFLLVMVNGRPVTPLTVDRPIADGLIVVPFGISGADVRSLEAAFPLVGQPPGSKPGRAPRAN